MSKSKRLKFRNTAAYFIEEGFSNIFLHGFMSFAAVGVIAVCLLLTGSFFLIALNLDRLVSEIGDQSEIVVFIDEKLSTQEAMAVKDQIMKIGNIRSAEFVSRDTALERSTARVWGKIPICSTELMKIRCATALPSR